MTLGIVFLNVGNADSIVLLPTNAPAVIIDIPRKRQLETWLKNIDVNNIDCIYFTHSHKDHLPSLGTLQTFISSWRETRGIDSIRRLCLPTDAIRDAFQLLQDGKLGETQRDILRSSLSQLSLWVENGELELYRIEYRKYPDKYGDISLFILHPSFMFYEKHSAKYPDRLNETSAVMRLEYGEFRAIFLADIENEGVVRLLSQYKEVDLKCQLMKIAHHGAWPKNEDEYRDLLHLIDPEIAVLSVGSKNPHGHVVPSLFRELLDMRQAISKRLQMFVCTEITRTCMWSAAKRAEEKRHGLPTRLPCAGDIEIVAESTGQWVMKRRNEHQGKVSGVEYAACMGRADLDSK